MTINVKYFASLREQIGRSSDLVEALQVTTVAELWTLLHNGIPMPANVLAAVNMEYVNMGQVIRDGDEVAFFPPVTGG